VAITELYTGSEVSAGTEHSLTTDTTGPDADTTDGVFQAFIDLVNLNGSESIDIRVYEKVRSGDTQRIVYQTSLFSVQATPIWVSPALMLLHGCYDSVCWQPDSHMVDQEFWGDCHGGVFRHGSHRCD
jgi:hypothetical protein